MSTCDLARQAVSAAAKVRSQLNIKANEGVCPYDIAKQLGLKVVFVDATSFEGVYSPTSPSTIMIGAERPSGRKRFTCSHEIGHHVFGHGFMVDELGDENSGSLSPEEILAQRFASALLMPKIAVMSAMSVRNLTLENLKAEDIFRLSLVFGVGYTTFLTNLPVIFPGFPWNRVEQFKKMTPKILKSNLARLSVDQEVYIVDQLWNRPTIDLDVGDHLIIQEKHILDHKGIQSVEAARVYCAQSPGVGVLHFQESNKKLEVRVSRYQFKGLSKHRHLEECDDE